MALAAKRSKIDTPRGTVMPPKRILGESGTANPLSTNTVINGHTLPSNPQPNISGIVENKPVLDAFPTRRTIVDSEYVPLSHIIVNAEGDKWPVDYYQQFLGLNDELMPLAKHTSPVHQQYTKINEFVIHVTGPLSQQQNSETKDFTVTGEATVFFGLIPNKGDMFVGDVGDGRAGLFTVTESERLTYTKEACYSIRYTMVDFITPENEADLESKVVRTFYFELALVELHERPFLTEADYNVYINLKDQDLQLRNYFLLKFWSRKAGNLALPKQLSLTHDAYHAKFCSDIGLGDYRRPITTYVNGYTSIKELFTIWDVFTDMDASQIPWTHQTLGVTSASTFMEATIFRGIAWSQYTYTVYPTSDFFTPDDDEAIRTTVSNIRDTTVPVIPEVDPEVVREMSKDVDFDDSEWNPTPSWDNIPQPEPIPKPRPMFPLIGNTNYYVFSESFYQQNTALMSSFEQAAFDMLSGKSINAAQVATFCVAIRKQPLLQQFYHIPILLLMIKYTQRGSL